MTLIARSVALISLVTLLDPGRLTVQPIVSAMYTSTTPLGSIGTSTINFFPSVKRMSSPSLFLGPPLDLEHQESWVPSCHPVRLPLLGHILTLR